MQPWLSDNVKAAPAWRTKLLLPAANNTWVSASKAHLVTRKSLYLNTSCDILHDLAHAISGEKYQSFAAALDIPFLTEKEFKLAQFTESDIKPQTQQVLQRLENHQLFPLLCSYRSLPISQAAKWAEEARGLLFAQVPALQRECTVIPNYRLESEHLQYVDGKHFYFVGSLWSACQWQALATFLVKQLDLPVAAHVVIRLLESNDRDAQAAVFEQAGYPVPALLMVPEPPVTGSATLPPSTASKDSGTTPQAAEPAKHIVPVNTVDLSKVTFTEATLSSVFEVQPKSTFDDKPDSAERTEIGRWCEELVHSHLLANQETFSEVDWPNQTKESFKPYDFVVKRNGVITYIEVKGTTSLQKDIIYLSAAEWHWMLKHRECYSIFRVNGAQRALPSIKEIPAPGLKILSGELIPHAIELQI